MGKIIVVSDLHLGDKTKRDDFYTSNGERTFFDFLEWIKNNDDEYEEIIFAGDLFELWQCKLNFVLQCYCDLFEKLNYLKEKGIKLVYVPGNHDSIPFTKFSVENMDFHIGPFSVTKNCYTDVNKELAFPYYVPEKYHNLIIEHGHRFDGNCQYAFYMNIGKLTYGATWELFKNEIIKFFTWVSGFIVFLWQSFPEKFLSIFKGKKANTYEKNVKTDRKKVKLIDKKLKSYYCPSKREYRLVFKDEGYNQYLETAKGGKFDQNATKKYVIIGHTHIAEYVDLGNGSYYVNSGCWCAKEKTFVEYDSVTNEITIYSWDEKNKIPILK